MTRRVSRWLVSVLLRRIRVGSLLVVEGDERRVYGSGAPIATVRLHSSRVWPMLLRGSRGLAEALAQGLWDSPDLVALIRLAARNAGGLDRLRARLAPVRGPLQRAAALLHEAADLTRNPSLKKFLHARADAFISNEYRASDADWMDLDAPLDITIGPYETYADELFGYKASFEAYINLRDDAETAKLGFFSHHLQSIEDNLPEDKKYRSPKLGSQSPIRVVNVVSSAGERGVQTAAYNLPNDEVVVNEKGSKQVMLKNIQEAKFNGVLVPISRRVLPAEAQSDVNFQAFFTHIVAHELMHGLGPHQIAGTLRKPASTPRLELKDYYGPLEEAKADVTGLFALQFLIDQGQARPGQPLAGLTEKNLYTTYVASAFRSLRFGATDAHARGQTVQINYLLDKGAVSALPDGRFKIDFAKMKQAVRDLDHDLLTLEAAGDYAGAKSLFDRMDVIRPAMRSVLDKLSDIPVDIEPHYVAAEQLAPRSGQTMGEEH